MFLKCHIYIDFPNLATLKLQFIFQFYLFIISLGKIDRYELIRAFQELGIEIDDAEAIKLLKR